MIIAANVYNHVLCFVCDEKAKLGICMAQLEALAESLK